MSLINFVFCTMPSTQQSLNKKLVFLMSGTVGDNVPDASGLFGAVTSVSSTQVLNKYILNRQIVKQCRKTILLARRPGF